MAKAKAPVITDEEIERVRQASAEADLTGPRAVGVRYDSATRSVVLSMRGGATLIVPMNTLRGFDGADDKQLSEVVLYGNGSEIHWPGIDEGIEVSVLIPRALGLVSVSENARKAGSAKSPAKVAAARANGAKGGRPRKAVAA